MGDYQHHVDFLWVQGLLLLANLGIDKYSTTVVRLIDLSIDKKRSTSVLNCNGIYIYDHINVS